MKKITILSLLVLSMFTIVGCSNDNTESKFIESGFLIDSEFGELTPYLSTAIKGASNQVIQGDLFGGIFIGSLCFIKSDNQITFSKYAGIFTE